MSQGDGILIRQDGTNILIDGGSNDVKDLLKYRIGPSLNYLGIDKIDYAFLSHLHLDHYSGMIEMLRKGKIKNLVLTDYGIVTGIYLKILTFARSSNTNVIQIKSGDTFSVGKLRFRCLHPYKGYVGDNPNSYSMVLRMDMNNFSCLFTGDLEAREEKIILDKYYKDVKDIDLLKVGHHGSKTSTTPEFLEAIKPKLAVISCARKSIFKHPSKEVVDRIKNRVFKVFMTKESGEIDISLSGNDIDVIEKIRGSS